MERLARFCLRRRKLVAAGWLVALGMLLALSHAAGSAYSTTFDVPGTDSTRATQLLRSAFPEQSGDADFVVAHTLTGPITDPATRAQLTRLFDRLAAVPHVREVVSPYAVPGQVSADRRTAFAVVHFDATGQALDRSAVQQVITVAAAARAPGLQVELAGDAIGDAQRTNPGPYEAGGLAVAAVVLFLAFGSLLAMTLPLLSAGVALGIALSVITLLSHVVSLADFAPGLASLLGLGAGIDYALFVVSRHRQHLLAGDSVEDAVAAAAATSGRTVLFAGVTVCIAVLGMLALNVGFLAGMAVAAALAVALTMAAALTLLPALLGFLGLRVLSRRERRRLTAHGPRLAELSPSWLRWATSVQRHRWAALGGSLLVIGLLAVPLTSLRFGNSDQGNDPTSSTTRRAYDLLAAGFGPGFNAPLLVATDTSTPAGQHVAAQLHRVLPTVPGVAAVGPLTTSPNGRAAVLDVYPSTRPQDKATTDLLHRLRDTTIPAATRGSTVPVYVGGTTASFADFTHVLAGKLPLFVGIIVALSFLLLLIVFRSILVPVKAALLNLLSIAGAFGAVIAVFQWGWGGHLIGIRPGPVEAFLPVMLFAILFGLSMDYEVFLVSRIREEWLRTGDNAAAVTRGLAATGRLITAAAAIMIVIFSSFVLGGERVIKLFGFGFAVAVFLDAVLIRSVLVPAIMQLAGRANWWLPPWLDRWLPHLHAVPEQHELFSPPPTTVPKSLPAR